MSNNVIRVEHLTKAYRLYDKKSDRLKEALHPLHKSYHTLHYALKDINFEVGKGETVGIIGTNGSGKSTLLKILTGVVAPTEGKVEVQGKISALLELGAGFNPDYTGIENIYLNGTIMGYTKEEMDKKISGIVAFADIGEFINQPVKTYSSGMFARLAFAVSINVEPDVLIVDEALSVGDVFFQNKCFRKFDELRDMGTTILFVSHDVESVKQLCSRVIWIEQGVQQMFGDSVAVCTEYFNHIAEKQNQQLSLENDTKICATQIDINNAFLETLRCPRAISEENSIISDDVEILSIYVTDENGKMEQQLYCGNIYTVSTIVRATRNVDSLIIGFRFEDRKGLFLLSDNTYAHNDEKKTFGLKKNEVMKVDFRLRMPGIRSGDYVVTSAAVSGTQECHKVLCWLHGNLPVHITRKGYDLSLLSTPTEMSFTPVKKVELI